MAGLDLDPNEQLLYFIKLEKAEEMIDLGQNFVEPGDCIVTDVKIKVCGPITSTPVNPAPGTEGCFELKLDNIGDVEVQSVTDAGIDKYLVRFVDSTWLTGAHVIWLYPASGTQTSAEELAAQIQSALT